MYQQVYRKFWTDPKVQEKMTANDRYLFLYILTNPLNNILGCYEIGFKHIEIETGLSQDEIMEAVDNLISLDVISFNFECNEILIKNYTKHNWSRSPKLDACILKELPNVKTAEFQETLAQAYNSRATVTEPYYI